MAEANIKNILKNKNVKNDKKTIKQTPKGKLLKSDGTEDKRAFNEGRPQYKDNAELSKAILIKLTEDEYKLINDRVESLGIGNRTHYLRQLLKGDIPNF